MLKTGYFLSHYKYRVFGSFLKELSIYYSGNLVTLHNYPFFTGQVKVEKGKVENLENELQKASRIIESQKGELVAARKTQKTLVEQCEHVEGESRELQEFLQIEKMALSETLKDAETEIEKLKEVFAVKENEVKEVEERCGHLVRLGEQRHQELLTSKQQLKSFSEMAKSMLIAQVIKCCFDDLLSSFFKTSTTYF